jgi:hypothetical protein
MAALFHGLQPLAPLVALAQTASPAAPSLAPAVPDVSPPSEQRAPVAGVAAAPPVVAFASLEEGMGARSTDKDFSVAVHLLLQLRYEHVESDAGRSSGFVVPLARPALRGVAFQPWVQYFVQWELAGTPLLLDAEIVAQPAPEIGLKVGQFLTPFSREFLVPPGALLFPDYAPSNILFRTNRDTGAMLLGSTLDGHVEYFAAAVNGNGINRGGNDNAELEWIGRLGVNVLGNSPYTEIPQLVTNDLGLSFGVNASRSEVEQIATTVAPGTGATTTTRLGSAPTTKLGGDVAFHGGRFSLVGEGYTRTIASGGGAARSVSHGGFAQAGLFLTPRTLELAARGDLIDADAGRTGGSSKRIDGAVVYYVRDNYLKVQLAYAWTESRAAAATPPIISNAVRVQVQLWF